MCWFFTVFAEIIDGSTVTHEASRASCRGCDSGYVKNRVQWADSGNHEFEQSIQILEKLFFASFIISYLEYIFCTGAPRWDVQVSGWVLLSKTYLLVFLSHNVVLFNVYKLIINLSKNARSRCWYGRKETK